MNNLEKSDYSSCQIGKNILTVTSEGVIRVQPNIAIITIGATTENAQANEAQAENAKIINNVIETLLQHNIKPDKIKTTEFRMNVQYDYVDGKQVFRGYEVGHLLEVTLDDINKTGKVIDMAVKSGANNIRNLQFTIDNSEKFYNDALVSALKNAREKAITIADTLHVSLNKIPLSITELNNESPIAPFRVASLAKSESTSIMAGQIEIKALVNVKYSYE